MSTYSDDNDATGTVRDDENYVDKERKKLILQRRREADEWKRELITDAKLGELNYQTAISLWGDRVRDYLIAVEPLLKDEGLDGATEAYRNEDVGRIEIPPPPELQYDPTEDRGHRNPVVDGYELVNGEPEAKSEIITGLKDVIEREAVTATWEVQGRLVGSGSRGRRRKTITRTRTAPLSKTTLQNAIRITDEFLQNANLGVDTSDGIPTYGFEEVGSDQPELGESDQ